MKRLAVGGTEKVLRIVNNWFVSELLVEVDNGFMKAGTRLQKIHRMDIRKHGSTLLILGKIGILITLEEVHTCTGRPINWDCP